MGQDGTGRKPFFFRPPDDYDQMTPEHQDAFWMEVAGRIMEMAGESVDDPRHPRDQQ